MTFLRNQKTRNLLLQALFVLFVLVVVLGGWRNARAVMQAQNMVSDFSTRRARGPRLGKVLAVLAGGAVLAVALVLLGRTPGAPLVDLPRMAGLNIRGGLRGSPEFAALLVAIGIYGGAYIGEIVRGGFQSVGRGQLEAARSLGLRPWHVFARVRLPLALWAMLPILASQYVWLIKVTTMGVAVVRSTPSSP